MNNEPSPLTVSPSTPESINFTSASPLGESKTTQVLSGVNTGPDSMPHNDLSINLNDGSINDVFGAREEVINFSTASKLDDSKTTQKLGGSIRPGLGNSIRPDSVLGTKDQHLNLTEQSINDAFGSGFVVNAGQTSGRTINLGSSDPYREPVETPTLTNEAPKGTPEGDKAFDALHNALSGNSSPKTPETPATAQPETVVSTFTSPTPIATLNNPSVRTEGVDYVYNDFGVVKNTGTKVEAPEAPEAAPVAPTVETVPPAQTTAPEAVPAAPEAAPIITIGKKIEEGINDVVSGKEKSVTIELDEKSAYLTALNYRIAKETDPMVKVRLEQEKVAAEKKESRISASGSALSKIKEKLTDPSLTNAEREALEKRRDTLEKINGKLETQRQKLDRGFVERGLSFFRDNVAERWRKGSWKTKVAVGLGLGAAGIAASVSAPALLGVLGVAGVALRGLGGYNLYQGTKQRDIVKLAEAVQKATAEGKDTEATIKEADKIITENSWNKKGLFFAGLMSIALPEFLKHTEMGQNLVHGMVDKVTGAYDYVTGTAPGVPVATADPFAPGTKVGTGSALAPEGVKPDAVVPGGTPATAVVTPGGNTGLEGLGYTGDGMVRPGDNMYKIIERSFHISDHVATKGGQYNAIENILAKIKADPTAYGIKSGDVNMLQPGEQINLAKIQEVLATTKIGTESIYDHANKLPAAVVKGIEEYMPEDAKASLAGSAAVVQNAGPAAETASNDALVSPVNTAPSYINNGIAGSGNVVTLESPTDTIIQNVNSSPDIDVMAQPMTSAESTLVLSNLQTAAAIRNITPFDLSTASTQNVVEFVKTPNPAAGVANMIDLIKAQEAASGKLMLPSENVAQYLQRSTLAIIRKN